MAFAMKQSESFLSQLIQTREKALGPHIVAVGGGKGGVGKSSIALMMGLCLAEKGCHTIMVDADFTGANLHGYLGVCSSKPVLSTFLKNDKLRLVDLVQPTLFKRLSVIVGSLGMNSAEGHQSYSARRLLAGLSTLPADYVILDLGAEGSAVEIDLFLAAHTGLVISSNDSLSLHTVFNFIRAAQLRRILQQARGQIGLRKKVSEYLRMADTSGSIPLVQAFKRWGYEAEWVRALTQSVRPKILLNMCNGSDSCEPLQALRIEVSRLLSTRLDYWGLIHTEPLVRQAIRSFNPTLLCTENNLAFADIRRIVDRKLLQPQPPEQFVRSDQRPAGVGERSELFRGTMCSTRCLAWRSCRLRNGGLPCAMNPKEVLMREACYA
ncbi:MAG TPA: P-loop NTPase [bacterium]|nr:P-loop NTPase [bacterium]